MFPRAGVIVGMYETCPACYMGTGVEMTKVMSFFYCILCLLRQFSALTPSLHYSHDNTFCLDNTFEIPMALIMAQMYYPEIINVN